MNPKYLLAFLILAVLGYLTLGLLFTRFHPAARWGQRIDRAEAIALARTEAARQGLDVAGWTPRAKSELRETVEYYLADKPHTEIAPLLSPAISKVIFNEPKSSRSVEVSLDAGGRLVGTKLTEWKPAESPPAVEEETKRRLDAALDQLTGSLRSRFAVKSEGVAGNESRLYSWEYSVADEPRVKLGADIRIERGLVQEASLRPVFSPNYLDEIRNRRQRLNGFKIIWLIFLLVGLLVAVVYYVLNVVRKQVRHRSPLLLLAGLLVVLMIWSFDGDLFNEIYSGLGLRRQYLGAALAWLIVSLLNLVFVSPFVIFWAAGYPLASQQKKNPLSGVELLIRGQVASRLVGKYLTIGLTLGWLIPVATLLLAGSRLFPNAGLKSPDGLVDILMRPLALTGLTEIVVVQLYVISTIYVFVLPLILSFLHRPVLARLIVLVIGAVCLLDASSFWSSLPSSLIIAFLSMVVVDQLMTRVDLLAAIVALLAGDFAVKFCALVSQSSASLRSSGMRGWVTLGVLVGASAAVAWKGRILGEYESRALWTAEGQPATRGDRDRIKAEFEVARRAQQQMLPERPPAVSGIEIAAVCRPAREVGGDLYDFISLPDGRLGIVVADVSGKGVPASLYMTLTKGLLVSVAETASDPGEILREVNRHLYLACRRKTFVTLLLGVIDPERRTFSYARAGHNPPVWRQKMGQRTTLLHARGMGLGLNPGDVFDRTLEVESIGLEPHDTLFLYSDGITEAMNEQREEYGEARLMSMASGMDGIDAEGARDAVLASVSAFLGKTPPQDDQTLVVVRVL